jgi:hypothetical protein
MRDDAGLGSSQVNDGMSEYRVGHLLLLIGSNPLPNAVAGRLLAVQGGTVSLICSGNSFEVAGRLQRWLKGHGLSPRCPRRVEESDPASIFQVTCDELKIVDAERIGLSYTGGTKAMSVHAYRAVEHWVRAQQRQGKNIESVFSYLNPRRLEMVFDPADPASGERGRTRPVMGAVRLCLTDMLELHGWTLKNDPNSRPVLPASASALAKICASEDSFKEWRRWAHDELRAKCRKPDKDEWKGRSNLPQSLDFPTDPSLQEIVQSLKSESESPADDLPLKQPAFKNDAKHFCEWLDGKWLEHHVLNTLDCVADNLGLHQQQQNIITNEVEFDVDVIAIHGYQLFAFSCSTDSGKGLLKSKLFEAFIRARQLGGDEARVALVCCSKNPETLEQETRRDVDPEGRIHVFGCDHLADLAAHLKQWIQKQSKGA